MVNKDAYAVSFLTMRFIVIDMLLKFSAAFSCLQL